MVTKLRDRNCSRAEILTCGMKSFGKHYLSKTTEAREPYASPLRATDLSKLPPALLITAENDVLRPEGLAYGEKLKEFGVDCNMVDVAGQDHGFLTVYPPPDDSVNKTFRTIFKSLRDALDVSPQARL